MARRHLKPVVLGALSFLAVMATRAETQRTEVVSYTDADAKPYASAFEPLLRGETAIIPGESSDVRALQLDRLSSGKYAGILVGFKMHRSDASSMEQPLVAHGALPDGEGDVATLATCGDAMTGGGYVATVQIDYVMEKGKWVQDSLHYEQVKECDAAMHALAAG